MNRHRISVGKKGEEYAARFLQDRGFALLEQGYRSGRGELDIVARDGDELVFVEVKCNSSTAFGAPEERVGPRKQAQLTRLAQAYLQEHGYEDQPVRFDVVAVQLDRRLELIALDHIRDAFWAEEDEE